MDERRLCQGFDGSAAEEDGEIDSQRRRVWDEQSFPVTGKETEKKIVRVARGVDLS